MVATEYDDRVGRGERVLMGAGEYEVTTDSPDHEDRRE